MVVVEGRLSDKDGENKIIVNKAAEVTRENLNQIVMDYNGPVKVNNYGSYQRSEKANNDNDSSEVGSGKITIKFSAPPTEDVANKLKEIFSTCPGNYAVYLLINNDGKWQRM